jgi:hypothetical protein
MLHKLNFCFTQIAILSILLHLSDQMTHVVIFKYRTRFWNSSIKSTAREVFNNDVNKNNNILSNNNFMRNYWLNFDQH